MPSDPFFYPLVRFCLTISNKLFNREMVNLVKYAQAQMLQLKKNDLRDSESMRIFGLIKWDLK